VQNPATIVAEDEFLSHPGVLHLADGGAHAASLTDAILHSRHRAPRFALTQALVGSHVVGCDRRRQRFSLFV
jgi:hypothetical protein